MSYSCSDFVNDCEANADGYDLPELNATARDMLDLPDDPEEWSEGEQLRALAERVAGAIYNSRAAAQLLPDVLTFIDSDSSAAAIALRARLESLLASLRGEA